MPADAAWRRGRGRRGGRRRAAVGSAALGFGLGEFAGQQQALGPGDQVVGDAHDLQPDAVMFEVAERQVPEAGVFVVSDVVLDAGAATVIALELGDVFGLVGEDRLEAMPVQIGERQLRAGVRALAAHQHPRPRRPAREVKLLGDLGDLSVGPIGAVLVSEQTQSLSAILVIAARTGSVRSKPTEKRIFASWHHSKSSWQAPAESTRNSRSMSSTCSAGIC